MDTSANEYLKGVIEALLFISEKPVTLEQLVEVMNESVGGIADMRKLLDELKGEYETRQRGMVIVEIAGGYQMLSSQHYASYVRNFLKIKVKEKLSRPALETLAIIAYKQPVSRGDIEQVRGVNSDGVVLHLLNKDLIKIVGKKDVAGRPFLYGTTKAFLEYFGLKSLRDLPKLEDVSLLLVNNQEGQEPSVQTEESQMQVSQDLDNLEQLVSQEKTFDAQVAETQNQDETLLSTSLDAQEANAVNSMESGHLSSETEVHAGHHEPLDSVSEPENRLVQEHPETLRDAIESINQESTEIRKDNSIDGISEEPQHLPETNRVENSEDKQEMSVESEESK